MKVWYIFLQTYSCEILLLLVCLYICLGKKTHLNFSFSFTFCVDDVVMRPLCRSLWLEGRWWYHCPTPHCMAPMPAVISSMGMWHSDKLPSCPFSLAPRSFIYPFSPICIVLFLLPSRSSCSVIGLDKMKICWMQMWNFRMSVHATLEYITHVIGKYKYTMLVIGDSL